METVYPKTRFEWRAWLKRNHRVAKECLLLHYTKKSGKPTLSWQDVVEEALCFGWIDGKVRKLDAQRYTRRLTPRKQNSTWSRRNRQSAERLIATGEMAAAGMEKVREAKENGNWDVAYAVGANHYLPTDLKRALQRDEAAWVFFQMLPNSMKHVYLHRIAGAKRPETRARWIARAVEYSAKGLKPYIDGKPVWVKEK